MTTTSIILMILKTFSLNSMDWWNWLISNCFNNQLYISKDSWYFNVASSLFHKIKNWILRNVEISKTREKLYDDISGRVIFYRDDETDHSASVSNTLCDSNALLQMNGVGSITRDKLNKKRYECIFWLFLWRISRTNQAPGFTGTSLFTVMLWIIQTPARVSEPQLVFAAENQIKSFSLLRETQTEL